MNPTIQLGRIAGIRIGLNWSWLVVFALIGLKILGDGFAGLGP